MSILLSVGCVVAMNGFLPFVIAIALAVVTAMMAVYFLSLAYTRLYEKFPPPNPRGADRGAHVRSSNL